MYWNRQWAHVCFSFYCVLSFFLCLHKHKVTYTLYLQILDNLYRKILTGVFRALVKNPVKKSFNIIFMGNEKSCQNIN